MQPYEMICTVCQKPYMETEPLTSTGAPVCSEACAQKLLSGLKVSRAIDRFGSLDAFVGVGYELKKRGESEPSLGMREAHVRILKDPTLCIVEMGNGDVFLARKLDTQTTEGFHFLAAITNQEVSANG